jgi:hypothetical protein
MGNNDSLTKAKYAFTILKVAKTVDRDTAARLIEGLATDFPAHDDRPDVARAHEMATDIFGQLVDSIRSPLGGPPGMWDTAFAAVANWRRIIE